MSAKTLAQVQAQNGLWDELWLVAVDEAYNANDAVRRMAEIAGLPRCDVVEVYFTYHPEMKDWANGHLAAGTCEAAIREIRAELDRTRKARKLRAEQIATWRALPLADRCAPPPEDAPDWMKPFMLGPARIDALSPGGPVEQEPAKAPEQEPPPVIYSTGAPGRPTSIQLVELEMKRRAAAGEMDLKSCAAEATVLSAWLRNHHPNAPPLTAKTIQNVLGSLWRERSGGSIPN